MSTAEAKPADAEYSWKPQGAAPHVGKVLPIALLQAVFAFAQSLIEEEHSPSLPRMT